MSLLPGAAISSGGYNIDNSLRFRNSASAALTRTPSVASNRTTWTWSGWVKRGALTTSTYYPGIFAGYVDASNRTEVKFTPTIAPNADVIEVLIFNAAVIVGQLVTTQVFRDPSAWYHIVVQIDTTQATAANRMRLYVNGSQVTAFSTNTIPAQNTLTQVNNTSTQAVGRNQSATDFFDGYLAEVNFIDGQALTPSSFGNTNPETGVWQPARYTGTYGTNGFYQNYSSIALTSGSNTGLGRDFSGNGNFYNTSNISVTAGATYDAMTDVPTLTSATTANYCVLNSAALVGTATTNGSTSNANLTATTATTSGSGVSGTMAVNMPSGNKWYWEVTPVSGVTTATNACQLGVVENSAADGLAGTVYAYNSSDSPTYTNGDTISFAYDDAASILYCYKNNVLAKTITSVSSSAPLIPLIRDNLSGGAIVANFNFGQRPFLYTPPTGYNRLNTFNLPDSTIVKGNTVMDATIYAGNGTAGSATQQTINTQFSPNFLWLKNRTSASSNHILIDSIRGNNSLSTNNTAADVLNGNQALGTNNYLVAENNGGGIAFNPNLTGNNYVGWIWNAGASTVTNTSGTISSQVRANTTAGFSVVTYTIPASGSGWTIGHGLGVAPQLIIAKSRSNAVEWKVYHRSIGNTGYVVLNSTGGTLTDSGAWNNTSPTSTVFTNGTTGFWGASFTYVAYCWTNIPGFSRFGSYTGNGNADGSFVYTGFRPKFVLFKNINVAADWLMLDSSRNLFNVTNSFLRPNLSDAETAGTSVNTIADFLSNGFKLRGTGTSGNGNGNTIIYMAFAENPFKNSLAR